jgi:hypothetical protein
MITDIEREILDALDVEDWVRPMDIGGRNGSNHSNTLNRLVRKGLVERRRRGTLMNELGSSRGSYEYRRVAGNDPITSG